MAAKKPDPEIIANEAAPQAVSAPTAADGPQPETLGPEIRQQKFRDARGRVHAVRVQVLSPAS